MAVECRKCKHFFITWDPKNPYGCKAFGIKSKRIPSVEIYLTSGKECLKFQKKETSKKK
jgi:hypothetical protein